MYMNAATHACTHTVQYAHKAAMMQYFATAPVMQHLKSASYYRTISPVTRHREERMETQAEKKVMVSKRGGGGEECKYMKGR